MCKTILKKQINYKELWEGLKVFDGHRRLKAFSKHPESEYKTIKEYMKNLEALSAQGTLAKMLKHKKKERPWEFE
jgi:hypothetical protein